MDLFFISLSLLLFVVACWFLKARNKWLLGLAFIIGFVIAFLCSVYIVSDAFTNEGIDEAVLYHLSVGLEGAGFSDFIDIMVFSVFLLLSSLVYAYCCTKVLSRKRFHGARWGVAGLFLASAAFAVNPGVDDIATVGTYYFSGGGAKDQLPQFYRKGYVRGLKKGVEQPKNLVVIYGESLERTYFDNALFPELLPNLTALEDKSLSFTNIRQLPGTGWTIGGMVASQCGVPLVASSGGNGMDGVDSFLPGARCLGDILSEKGYELDFIGGADTGFAGKGSFYRTHGFDTVEGLKELGPRTPDADYRNAWGLHDDTTFKFAKERFDEMAEGKRPFALVTLTLGTHHPDGFLSRECKDTSYRQGDNPVLNAVSCTDELIPQFINYISRSKHADDTLIVLVSDHLAINNTASDLLKEGTRRDLFMVMGSDIAPARITRPGSTLDMAPTVLSLLGYQAEAVGMGRNLLGSQPTFVEAFPESEQKIREDYAGIRSLWMFPSLKEGLVVNPDEERVFLGKRSFHFPVLFKMDDDYQVNEVFMSSGLYDGVSKLTEDSPFLWLDDCRKVAFVAPMDREKGICVLAAKGAYAKGVASRLDAEEVTNLDFDDLERAFDENGSSHYDLSLAERLTASLYGGKVYIDGKLLNMAGRQINLEALSGKSQLEAEPLPGYKFVKWQGVNGEAKYRQTISLDKVTADGAIAPAFDIDAPASGRKPELRSAWSGIAEKGGGVVSQLLSPGNAVDSIARLARDIGDGVAVDIRSVGGFLPINGDHFIRVNEIPVDRPGRGMKMVVIRPSGEVVASRHYDTSSNESESDELAEDISKVEAGNFMLFSTQDDFTRAMTSELTNALHDLGFNM